LDARGYVDGDIDVGVVLREEFVAHPTAREADDERSLRVVSGGPGICCGDQEITETSFGMGEFYHRSAAAFMAVLLARLKYVTR
jgi:hypothetical protein